MLAKKLLFISLACFTGIGMWVAAREPVRAADEAAAADVVVTKPFHPSDPLISKQSYLFRINAPGAWALTREHTQQREIVIAVLDTGVAIDHPDLASNIWLNAGEVPGDGIDNDENSFIDDVNGWDFILSQPDPRPKITDNNNVEALHHGTVVAGIIAAQIDNNIGIAGASYNAKIMPLRVLDSSGSGNTILLAQAIEYAVENRADVINLSLVGDIQDPLLTESIRQAYLAGVAVVAASGNQQDVGINLDRDPRYPVCEPGGVNRLIGVAALDERNELAPFSNYGSSCIDISAPGTGIFSSVVHRDGDPLLGCQSSRWG